MSARLPSLCNVHQSLRADTWARIHESVITYDGHISRPGITELELGPSENSYSRARKRSVIVVCGAASVVGRFSRAPQIHSQTY